MWKQTCLPNVKSTNFSKNWHNQCNNNNNNLILLLLLLCTSKFLHLIVLIIIILVWWFQVAFNLSEALANKEDQTLASKEEKNKDEKASTNRGAKDDIKVPRDYKMVLSKVEQSIGVFSEGPEGTITVYK